MLETINSLWFGPRLGPLEQLSILSATEQGHAYVIYSYEPTALAGVPEGVPVRDAREVMNDPKRVRLFGTKFKALGSDFFRYELLKLGLGYWADLDVLFLKPLKFATEYVLGWERADSINGAVLKLPPESEILDLLRSIPEKNWCPPFFGPRRRLSYYVDRLREGDVYLENLPWGVAGPAMLTYLIKNRGLAADVQPKPVFYPLEYDRANLLFEDVAGVDAVTTNETVAIHMWHSRLDSRLIERPPANSFLAREYQRHGILGHMDKGQSQRN